VVADTIESKIAASIINGGVKFYEAPEVKPEKKS
jgi:hypothetical protein